MAKSDFWVFAYGSLLWMPGFEYAERRLARLDGYRRDFALWSRHYRGTPEAPGLVLGLDWAPGESCIGMAYRVTPETAEETRVYLARRELVSHAYFEVLYSVALLDGDGDRVPAICYVVDRTHPQYAGGLDFESKARTIARRAGPSGTNRDYLFNTCDHLRELDLEDRVLFALEERVRAMAEAAVAR